MEQKAYIFAIGSKVVGGRLSEAPVTGSRGQTNPVPPTFYATALFAGNQNPLEPRYCLVKTDGLHQVSETNLVEVNTYAGGNARLIQWACVECWVSTLSQVDGWTIELCLKNANTICAITGAQFPPMSEGRLAITIRNPSSLGKNATSMFADEFETAYAPLLLAANVTTAAELKAKIRVQDKVADAAPAFFDHLATTIAALMPPPPPVAAAPAPAAPPVIEIIPSSDDDEEAPAPAPATIDLTAEDDEAPEVGAKRTAADAGFN